MLRSRPARHFRLLCRYEELVAVLAALAATRGVEVEASGADGWQESDLLRRGLDNYAELADRYRAYWPTPAAVVPHGKSRPTAMVEEAVAALRGWQQAAETLVDRLASCEREIAEGLLQSAWLTALHEAGLELRPPAGDPAGFNLRVVLLPGDFHLDAQPGLLQTALTGDGHHFTAALGERAALDLFQQRAEAVHGRLFQPAASVDDAAGERARQARQLAEARGRASRLRERLAALARDHDLAGHLGTLEWVRWAWDSGRGQHGTPGFGWIAGWAERDTAAGLATTLQHAGCRALVDFPAPPAGATAPVVFDNPRWATPFELLTRLYGVPGSGEADPSLLLGIVVPLLFGYMFGDVGQGLVILAVGLIFRRRHALARLAVPCGISAVAFGFAFGSLFGLEGIVPALWQHPIADPQAVLLPPLFFGVALLLGGMGLDLLGAHWSGRLAGWWRDQGGIALGYLAVLGLFTEPLAWLFAAGWCAWAAQRIAEARHRQALASLPGLFLEWLEQLVRLLVNTLSFARVGAFALAHAGLSLATVQLATAVPWGPGELLVLLLGNLLMLSLELLVVSIQTTRLMLFEFFLRFLHGEGRPLRPLAVPRFS